MTDKLIEQIKADREAGTPGPWRVGKAGPNMCPPVGTHKGLMLAMVTYGYNHPTEANARRIARVPEYEARIIADAEVIKAAVELADAALHYQRADFELVISASDKLTEKRAAFHRAMQGRKGGGPDDKE